MDLVTVAQENTTNQIASILVRDHASIGLGNSFPGAKIQQTKQTAEQSMSHLSSIYNNTFSLYSILIKIQHMS